MSGFITIERNLWKHPLFATSPMTEREAWMWMIARAAWVATEHKVGTDMVPVPRGSFMATLREMQSVFMWQSDKKVRTFLDKLARHGMIEKAAFGTKNARKTHVTICNYEEYQSRGRMEATENDLGTTSSQPRQSGRMEDIEKNTEKGTADARRTHDGRTTDAVKEQGNKGTREGKPSHTVPDDFLAFWDAFPHRNGAKKGRKDALKAWRAAIRKGVDPNQILSAAIRYQSDGAVHRGYGKGPIPWLNGECWNDDIEPMEANHAKRPHHSPAKSSPHGVLFAAARTVAGCDDGGSADPSGDMRDVTPSGEHGMADGQGGHASGPVLRVANGRS